MFHSLNRREFLLGFLVDYLLKTNHKEIGGQLEQRHPKTSNIIDIGPASAAPKYVKGVTNETTGQSATR